MTIGATLSCRGSERKRREGSRRDVRDDRVDRPGPGRATGGARPGAASSASGYAPVLRIDGFACTDSAVGHRLLAAGLICWATRPVRGMATLTEAGRAALAG